MAILTMLIPFWCTALAFHDPVNSWWIKPSPILPYLSCWISTFTCRSIQLWKLNVLQTAFHADFNVSISGFPPCTKCSFTGLYFGFYSKKMRCRMELCKYVGLDSKCLCVCERECVCVGWVGLWLRVWQNGAWEWACGLAYQYRSDCC